MKTIRYIPIMVAAAGLLLTTSCVKNTLYDTPHPEMGAVTVSLAELSADDNYVVSIDGKAADMTQTPFVYPELLKPGTHRLVVYDRVEGFTFDGFTARVLAPGSQNRADGASVIPLPDYLKSISQEIAVSADDTLRVTPVPVQRVRDLQLELEITQGTPDLIQTVTGTISGIAGTFDMEKGQIAGEAVATALSFVRNGNKIVADARLLGTLGAVQTLALDLVYADAGRTQHTEVDLTKALADFNGDMTTAYRVTGTLELTVGMDETAAEITGWETVDGGEVDASLK